MQQNPRAPQEPAIASRDRRAFLKTTARRSLAAVGFATVAGALAYKKPELRSFLPEVTAYAQTTGAGKFTLKGTT